MIKKQYTILTDRIGLRQWGSKDYEPFAEMNADPEVRKYFPKLMTHEESDRLIERSMGQIMELGYGFWATDIWATGEFIGMVGIAPVLFESFFTPCTEIGWRLKKSAWGNGYATEAAAACLDYAFNKLNIQEIYSFTAIPNTPSENVMKKIGMQKVGEFDHPNIPDGNWLKRSVLYKKEK